MAVTDSYATAQLYRQYRGQQDPGSDDLIDGVLAAVSRYIDRRLGRHFTKDAAAVAREFWPGVNADLDINGALFVDDITTSAGLVVKIDTDRDGSYADETALLATDYQLLPANAPDGPEPAPYTRIARTPWSTVGTSWLTTSPVQIEAVWGWPAVPEAIKLACCELAGIVMHESPLATNQFTALGDRISASPLARTLLNDLMRVYGRVVLV